jgi:hypothetical protein
VSLQALEREPEHRFRLAPITKAVSGFDGARIVTSLTDHPNAVSNYGIFSNATDSATFEMVYYTSTVDYDAGIVASLLHADSASPEANFSNVVDMLDWLNRD